MKQHSTPSAYHSAINQQYGQEALDQQLLTALHKAGMAEEALTPKALAAFENIHIKGRQGTIELAQLAGLQAGMRVLDIGCGIGGPARTLATEFGCQVTGLDLTEAYIQAAQLLTKGVGLSGQVTFRQGDALDMPFADASFDVVWTQHITMNIADKQTLFQQIHRVLKPGGILASHEVLAGPNQPPHYPVVWANDATISFLATPQTLKNIVQQSGFIENAWQDDSANSLKWLFERQGGTVRRKGPTIGLVLGHGAGQKVANIVRNLAEQRIRVVYLVYRRDA